MHDTMYSSVVAANDTLYVATRDISMRSAARARAHDKAGAVQVPSR